MSISKLRLLTCALKPSDIRSPESPILPPKGSYKYLLGGHLTQTIIPNIETLHCAKYICVYIYIYRYLGPFGLRIQKHRREIWET